MKKYNYFFGGILLIAGTSIGAGMLALPVVTAFGGLVPSLLIFSLVWAMMLATAYFFLEVNLVIKGEPNLISMAGKTLGIWGKGVSWVFYLLLLYSLLAAYLSACAPLFSLAFSTVFSIGLPSWVAPFLLPMLFGGCICFGTKGVDYLNRILMIGLILSYFFLIGTVPEHLEPIRFLHKDFTSSLFAIPIVITSFGYHIIIPTLTTYMGHNAKLLRKTIWIGSLIPLAVYVLWQIVVLGTVPLSDLVEAWQQGEPATDPLARLIGAPWLAKIAKFFSFFAIITSFLGISLSLSDFLTDGFRLKKNWEGKIMAIALSFAPPLLFLFFCERSFYVALEYGGAFVAILLGIIPSLMLLRLKHSGKKWYNSFSGKCVIYLVMALSLGVVVVNIVEKYGVFQQVLAPYFKGG